MSGGCGFITMMFMAVTVTVSVPRLQAAAAPMVAKAGINTPVTMTESGESWVLDNGIIQVTISKYNTCLRSSITASNHGTGRHLGTDAIRRVTQRHH